MSDESPSPQLSPDGKFYWSLPRGVLLLLVLMMVIAIVLAAGSHNTTTGQPSVTVSPSNSTHSQASTVAGVLLDQSGSGIGNTPSFTTSGDWEIDWSYDCTNFGQSGKFAIFVFNPYGSLADVAANQQGTKGAVVSNEHHGGSYYLEVDSPCDWHVTVKD